MLTKSRMKSRKKLPTLFWAGRLDFARPLMSREIANRLKFSRCEYPKNSVLDRQRPPSRCPPKELTHYITFHRASEWRPPPSLLPDASTSCAGATAQAHQRRAVRACQVPVRLVRNPPRAPVRRALPRERAQARPARRHPVSYTHLRA